MKLTSVQPLTTLTAILLAALITYGLRAGGLLLSAKLPEMGPFKRFMDAPADTILVSLVVPGILSTGPPGWLAAAITATCAYLTRNVFLALLLGMAMLVIHHHYM